MCVSALRTAGFQGWLESITRSTSTVKVVKTAIFGLAVLGLLETIVKLGASVLKRRYPLLAQLFWLQCLSVPDQMVS